VVRFARDKIRDPEAFRARIDAIYAKSDPETLDILELADGRVIERFTKSHLVDGRTIGRVWSFRDITGRLRTQASLLDATRGLQRLNETLEAKVIERTTELHRSELQFQQLVAGVTDYAIYMLDPKGNIISWNPGAERIKGYAATEVIGTNFSQFYTEEDRASGKPQQALATAARVGKYEAEAWRVRKDGTRFWANVLIDAIRGPDGTLVGFAKITRDMTEQRAMQEQLHQAQKMEAIGQLTGGVAHDFNNLLTVILGNLETLWRELPADDSRLRRAVDQATRGAQRAATLTQQLLAFSRRQPLNPKPTDINRLVSGMSDLIRRTLSEDISVETVLGGGLWRVEVDSHQLESALLNLAVNSRDAMPNGGKLTIETVNTHLDAEYVARFAELAPGQYVVICVTDTGTGMTREVMARAFDPFFTTKPVGSGTGLGLSQVFGFVKQSGGHVKLYSEVGEGTTIKIYLPRLMRDVTAVEPETPAPAPRGQATETILVVEDDEDVRRYSTECLRELGFSILEANDGASALRILDHHSEVSLLFTDVGLPGINGRELVEEARRRRPALRVLFTTGYARNAIVHQGRLDPGLELLTKPFTRSQLASRVRDVLDARPVPMTGQRVALIVEDEPLVRMFLAETLAEKGLEILTFGSAREALAAAERVGGAQLAFVDVGLPDRSGLELAAELRSRWPAMGIIVASGYGDPPGGALRADGRVVFLKKPFDAEAVGRALYSLGF
jgi:PAS domain S-box-containing protein